MTTAVVTTRPTPTFWSKLATNRSWMKFRANPVGWIGLIVIVAFVVMAICAPWLAHFEPTKTNWMAVRQAPSATYWLGTDEIGRDIYSRLLFGARASLMAGFFSVFIALIIGVPLGMIAGYCGGKVDSVISRCTEAIMAMPSLILAIALAAALGASLTNAMLAIGIANVPLFIRLTRGQVMTVKYLEYVEAAFSVGTSHLGILVKYILPNILAPLFIQVTLSLASAIIAESSLSFLGLGQQPPAASWGSMLNAAKGFLTQAPWMAIWPGMAIFVVVLAFNLFGDALRDALDPK
ncbi:MULTISPECIES: ABC transporter permease [Vibrio]|uniref:ABC transporter permease subunit n=2 Tax=Vibrio TaxID=662 RepID=A0A7X4LL97_9VIBR|nr:MULTISPECIES: ABC transporter permease [Vibrio]MBF9000211.1 ABC transporter permease [Vibrio nitrifigilis]MZI94033.1 ABC transporter permease subunit [Vibrio eleionomae]